MSIAISPTRTFTFESTVDPDVKITFNFTTFEDWDMENKAETGRFAHILRTSIISWEGIYVTDPETNEQTEEILPLTEDTSKSVMEWIQSSDVEMLKNILEARSNITPKK